MSLAVSIPTPDAELDPQILSSLAFLGSCSARMVKYPVDFKVLDRYITGTQMSVTYSQDDDCVIPVQRIMEAYEPGVVVCNMPLDHRKDYAQFPGVALVGWGAIYDSDLPKKAFDLYFKHFEIDELFLRECDRVFTGLSTVQFLDVPFEHLPKAHGPDRMGREARHGQDLHEIYRRICVVREKEGLTCGA